MPPAGFSLTPEEYEDGVAELLAEKFGSRGVVERNIRLPSKSGGRDRQVDILVRLPLPDMDDELMLVDCKRYGSKVNIKDVEAFVGMVEDTGAAIGLLVTTEGYTRGAVARAQAARGIRVQVIRVEELPAWNPPLMDCEFCRDEDAFPGMVYLDQQEQLEEDSAEPSEVTLGYCEKCGSLHVECPRCEAVNGIVEMRTNQWFPCDGGCGVDLYLRGAMTKDDLTSPVHDRLSLRVET